MTLRAYSRGGSPRWTSNAGRERYDGFFLGKKNLAKSKVAVSAPELLGAADDLVTLGSVAA
jgi:hypothetical protein